MSRQIDELVEEMIERLEEGGDVPDRLVELFATRDDWCRRLVELSPDAVAREIQARKMESLSLIAGGVARDVSALIMDVLGYADLALRALPREFPPPVRTPIVEIVATARRSAELCQQLLAYSGQAELTMEPLDLRELVEEMAHLLKVSVPDNVELAFDVPDRLPVIDADAPQLRQVILSLVTNASDALGGEQGSVTISLGSSEGRIDGAGSSLLFGELQRSPCVFLRVADTGRGMGEDERAKIFDPYYTTKEGERGLGLAAVLGIARVHGGAIAVESDEGRGSSFTVSFPVSEGTSAMAHDPPASAPPWRGTGTVLIVDDEPNARKIAELFLEEVGFRVLLAEDGRGAIEVFKDHAQEIVAVVLDLTMPHMDGEETFRELLKIRADVPVILSSGYAEQDVAERFAGQPWAGFIQKPYRFAALVFKLKEIL